MRELIYYPYFEVKNREWLKFALLYLDKLDPIIPDSGDIFLSNDYTMIINETDLIQKHRPTYEEGRNATLDVIEQIERILKHPKPFREIFSYSDFISRWKNNHEQHSILFREKYIDYWEEFCINNQLGQITDRGLMVSRDIANIYMTPADYFFRLTDKIFDIILDF